MIQYYTAIGRYELRTNERGEKHPILISNRKEYAPGLCEMLLWSSLLWHIRDQEELAQDFARRKAELHICDEYSLYYYCVRLERLGFLRRGSGYTAADALFRIARFLGLPPGEIVKRYCEGYIGSDSHISVIRLKPKPYRRTCPFLGPEGCSIHAAKPTVCALFPLGRAYIYPKDKLVYFCQDVSCGTKTETHTVREWLAEFGREYEDSNTLAWIKLTPRLSLWMHKHEPSLSETKKQDLWAQMLRLCYLQYDIRQPFTPQFAANTAALLGQMAGA